VPTRDEILAVLATIPDPEMPISIVDLGIVEDVRIAEDVRIDSPSLLEGGGEGVGGVPSPGPGSVTSSRSTHPPTASVEARGSVAIITLLPTFVGCPALDMIRNTVLAKVGALPGVDHVEVNFVHDPPWSADRITESGRASLRAHGVQVPDRGPLRAPPSIGAIPLTVSAPVPCPFCDSTNTTMESAFGPTRCRAIFYCNDCRNSFENIKRL
jgi:ring-1,2-phenylacetyl-CoA epoxidase subunit PaaD